jgi:vitamin B12 transport system permease protein
MSQRRPQARTPLVPAASAVLAALALGVAAGVAWLLAVLLMRHPASGLALPAGLLLGLAVGLTTHGPRYWRAAMAALATLLAIMVSGLGFIALLIAGNMGMGVLETLRAAGPGMLWQLLHLGTSPLDVLWYTLGSAMAAGFASRGSRAN